jgi:hypothetical protein
LEYDLGQFPHLADHHTIILPPFVHKAFVIPAFQDPSIAYYYDVIRIPDSRQTVGHQKACTILHQAYQCLLDILFCLGVHTAGCFIKDQDRTIAKDRTGNGNKLALPKA